MAHIAHEIAGLRLDGTSRSGQPSDSDHRDAEVATSSRSTSAIDSMFNESVSLSPVRHVADEKARIESLDSDVAGTQILVHYQNGVSLRLGKNVVLKKDHSAKIFSLHWDSNV